jgi:DNA-binding protein Fis
MTQGNRSQAARILGVSRPTLARKIRKYHLNGEH